MTPRHWAALLGLVNAFVAAYLALSKAGLLGPVACTAGGGCQIVQFSQWGWWLGVDVAQWGALFHATVLAVALWGVLADGSRVPRYALLGLAVWGVGFTVRLKWAEWLVLRTFCPWCAINAVSVVVLLGLAVADLRGRTERGAA